MTRSSVRLEKKNENNSQRLEFVEEFSKIMLEGTVLESEN